MVCTKCNNQLNDGAKFCNACGTSTLDTPAQQEQPAQQQQAPSQQPQYNPAVPTPPQQFARPEQQYQQHSQPQYGQPPPAAAPQPQYTPPPPQYQPPGQQYPPQSQYPPQYPPPPPQYQPPGQQYPPPPPSPFQPVYGNSQHAAQPQGAIQFVPDPLRPKRLHPSVRGLAYTGLLGFIAWVAALITPMVSLFQTVSGLVAAIPIIVMEAVQELSVSVWSIVWALIDGDFSSFDFGDISTVDRLQSILRAAQDGLMNFLIGLVLIFIVFIPLIVMFFMLRRNYTVGMVLILVNTGLCAVGSFLCYSALNGIINAVGVMPRPYSGSAQVTLIVAAVAIGLWIFGLVLYLTRVAKSKKIISTL